MKLLKDTLNVRTKNNLFGKWIFSGIITAALATVSATASGAEWNFDQSGFQAGQGVQLPGSAGTTPSAAAPVVVVQATASDRVFNYKDDCWIFEGPDRKKRMGAGKITSGKFTGMMSYHIGYGAMYINSLLTGGSVMGSDNNTLYACGSDLSCASNYTAHSSDIRNVILVLSYPVINEYKCYL